MPENNVSKDFIARIDAPHAAVINEMALNAAYIAPAFASYSIADTSLDETLTGTYSANSR